MTPVEELLQLARALAEDTLLDADEAARLLRCSRQAFMERWRRGQVAKHIPASSRKHPLWRKRDLIG